MKRTSEVMKIALGGKGLGCGDRTVRRPRSVSMLVMQMRPWMLEETTVDLREVLRDVDVGLSRSNPTEEMERSWCILSEWILVTCVSFVGSGFIPIGNRLFCTSPSPILNTFIWSNLTSNESGYRLVLFTLAPFTAFPSGPDVIGVPVDWLVRVN